MAWTFLENGTRAKVEWTADGAGAATELAPSQMRGLLINADFPASESTGATTLSATLTDENDDELEVDFFNGAGSALAGATDDRITLADLSGGRMVSGLLQLNVTGAAAGQTGVTNIYFIPTP